MTIEKAEQALAFISSGTPSKKVDPDLMEALTIKEASLSKRYVARASKRSRRQCAFIRATDQVGPMLPCHLGRLRTLASSSAITAAVVSLSIDLRAQLISFFIGVASVPT
jgi:hypothetical protein